MPPRSLTEADPLDDFDHRDLTFDGAAKVVHAAGSGPGVIVMAEMPGITPHVARFARWVRDAGFRVYMPSLFGQDGAVAEVEHGVAVFRRSCISAEFRVFGGGETSPVTRWLRQLARLAHAECGGPGVGAVGMCFTGNFALSMMLEPSMLAPVLCQPSLPLDAPAALEIASDELTRIGARLARDNLSVLAYRFKGDQVCKAERFAAYASALGDRFEGRELNDSGANPEVPPFYARHVAFPHSVVTVHLIDEAGQPTLGARDEILAFLRMRLVSPEA